MLLVPPPFIKVAAGSAGWNIASATYDSVQYDFDDDSLTGPRGLYFKADGTAFYVCFSGDDSVRQYDLSTAWDISTASLNANSCTVSNVLGGFLFRSDGLRFWIMTSAGSIAQYNLSSAWDLSSAGASAASTKNLIATTSETYDVAIDEANDKMYIAAQDNDKIHQFSYDPATNISTASDDTSFLDISTNADNARGTFLSSDGTRLYILDEDRYVYEYLFGTAGDISTLSHTSESVSIFPPALIPRDVAFKADGTKMYIINENGNLIHQFTVP